MFPMPATTRWSTSASPTSRDGRRDAAASRPRRGPSPARAGQGRAPHGPVTHTQQRAIPLRRLPLRTAQDEPGSPPPARSPRVPPATGRSSGDGCERRRRRRSAEHVLADSLDPLEHASVDRPGDTGASPRGFGLSASTRSPTRTWSRPPRDEANRLRACAQRARGETSGFSAWRRRARAAPRRSPPRRSGTAEWCRARRRSAPRRARRG